MNTKQRTIELEAGERFHIEHMLRVGTVNVYLCYKTIPVPMESHRDIVERRYQVGDIDRGYLSSDRHWTLSAAWNAARAIDVQNAARYMDALSV